MTPVNVRCLAALARRMAVATLALALLAMIPGCPPPPKPRELRGSGMDMFAPDKMRLHPLSRLVPAQADGQVEARIEFLDQMDDVTKGVGTLHVELADKSTGKSLGNWDRSLMLPAENQKAWDPITRTYLFRLPLAEPRRLIAGDKYVLTATMTFPNASTLRDTTILTAK